MSTSVQTAINLGSGELFTSLTQVSNPLADYDLIQNLHGDDDGHDHGDHDADSNAPCKGDNAWLLPLYSNQEEGKSRSMNKITGTCQLDCFVVGSHTELQKAVVGSHNHNTEAG